MKCLLWHHVMYLIQKQTSLLSKSCGELVFIETEMLYLGILVSLNFF